MKKIVKLFILVTCIFISIHSQGTTRPHKDQVIDANHFFSEQNKEKTYKISPLQKGKPVALVIKPVQNSPYSNKITLSITTGSKKKQCQFSSYTDLCVLDSSEATQGTLQIKCENLPCEASWKIYQPQSNQIKSSESVANLYEIPKDTGRLGIALQCKSVTDKKDQQGRLALVFSNLDFETFYDDSRSLYILIDSKNAGYIYLIVNPKYKSCASIKFIQGISTITSSPKEDVLKKDTKNIYSLSETPNNKDFRFDIAFHHPFKQEHNSKVEIKISGEKNGNRQTIRKNQIQFNPSFSNYDLSFAVPKIDTGLWKNLELEMLSNADLIVAQFVLQTSQTMEVEAAEFSYFNLKKGQKLHYRIVAEQKAEQKQQLSITASNDKIKVSQKSCSYKRGCQFDVQALSDIEGHIYIGVGDGESSQVITLQFGQHDSFTHKIKDLESIYIKKKLIPKKAYQIAINTPNILLYLSSTKKCPLPSQKCYERVGNINRHFIYTPESQESSDMMFYIKSLDTCQFTITILSQDTQFVYLKDSQPFVYLFDDEENSLKLRFKRDSKVDVSFNLISPVHALDLVVRNGAKMAEDQDDALISTEGFLQFKAEDSPKSQFSILIRKRPDYEGKFVHFTLIASTKGKAIRLQSGITHYETLPTLSKHETNNAEYVFEFNPEQTFILNFYSHNTKEEDVNIKLQLKALAEDSQKQKSMKLVIDKSSDVLNLNDVAKQLCQSVDDDDVCQIMMDLQNQMDMEIDVAITLMSRNTILELKDGLWQSYSVNEIAKTTHFYFNPRNYKTDVAINFKTTNPAIRLKYRLFYAGDEQIDPSQWPFPYEDENQIKQQLKYKPINHFSISRSSLRFCWPDCVALISIIDIQHIDHEGGSFSIMATNSIMELPEKDKIDITLKEGESKVFLIDLKYAIEIEQNIYFYVYHSIGLTSIYANVYSEKNDRVPDEDQYDFNLNSQQEKIISISAIKQIIKNSEMDDHLNLYLYIVVEGLSDSKLSLEFSFNQVGEPNEKLIGIDSMEHLLLEKQTNKIFYLPIDQPYEIKVSRQNGFPFYTSMVCKKDIDKCLKQFRNQKSNGEQILTKIAAYTAKPCESCFYMFKISTEEDPAQLNVHIQSKMSEVELTENKPIYDFTESDDENKYVFYAIRGQEVFVNVHISDGEVDVELTDLHSIQQKKSGKKIISMMIPGETTSVKKFEPAKMSKQQLEQLKQLQKTAKKIQYLNKDSSKQVGQSIMSAFGLSDKFIQFHVTIKSTNKETPSIYTITYSSGDREFQLQDGLISDYNLQADKQAVFFYSSRTAGHAYFTITMQKSSYLKDLDISFKYCEPKDNIIDDDCWVQYNTQKPPIKDKTPHPTMMYSLINKNHISISLTYKGSHAEKVSLGINHQQIMILPFDLEFPFILHRDERTSFIVELSNPGYIQIVIRKCDQSNPIFSYTFNYESFQKDQFTYRADLGANPKNRFVTKAEAGTLYMKIETSPQEQAMLSIQVRYSSQKIKDSELYAGGKGNVDYYIVDSSTAALTIKPPTCSDSKCGTNFKYYIMQSSQMKDLYSQLVCPSNFFSNLQFYSNSPIDQQQVTPEKNSDGTLTIKAKLSQQISYIGIKVVIGGKSGKQVFYKPIQIATVWGSISRTSHTHKLAITFVFICALLSILIWRRKNRPDPWKPVPQQI